MFELGSLVIQLRTMHGMNPCFNTCVWIQRNRGVVCSVHIIGGIVHANVNALPCLGWMREGTRISLSLSVAGEAKPCMPPPIAHAACIYGMTPASSKRFCDGFEMLSTTFRMIGICRYCQVYVILRRYFVGICYCM
jgi:hypothetical protein